MPPCGRYNWAEMKAHKDYGEVYLSGFYKTDMKTDERDRFRISRNCPLFCDASAGSIEILTMGFIQFTAFLSYSSSAISFDKRIISEANLCLPFSISFL